MEMLEMDGHVGDKMEMFTIFLTPLLFFLPIGSDYMCRLTGLRPLFPKEVADAVPRS